MTGVHFLNTSVGWATSGNFDRLLMTTDGGAHWVNVSPPLLRRKSRVMTGALEGANFANRSDFWIGVTAISSSGPKPVHVLHTTDGGKRWKTSATFPDSDGNAWIDFPNVRRGFVLVGNGEAAGSESVTLYRTSNGGKSWALTARSSSPKDEHGTSGAPSAGCDKSGITFTSSSSGWLSSYCASTLGLERTTNGGSRWHGASRTFRTPSVDMAATPSRRSSSVKRTACSKPASARSGTLDAIYATANGGSHWTLHQPPKETEGSMDILSAKTWMIGHGNVLYRTTDTGAHWTTDNGPVLNFAQPQRPGHA